MGTERKVYLGDGCYATHGPFQDCIVLTTEDGISVQNTITLEPELLKALDEFRKTL